MTPAPPPLPAVPLSSGTSMPLLGLGVWQIPDGQPVEQAVEWALAAGYRHVDTAAAYGNEGGVGRAVRSSGLPRSAVFVTTKMRPTDGSPEEALGASLERLGLDYVDLYLVHWPARGHERLWPGFERLWERGLARAIGVSNYSAAQLAQTIAAADVPPAVNQIDFNPFVYSARAVEAHRDLGVVLEAYSPLGRGRALRDPFVGEIARRHGRSPAQVLLRWAVQQGVPAIPKSGRRERIEENARVFDFSLTDEEVAALTGRSRH